VKNQGRHPLFNLACAGVAAVFLFGLGNIRADAEIRTPPAPSAVERELEAFAHALTGVTKYSMTVTVFDQKGSQTQNTVFDYTFSKPSKVTVHVISGTNKGITLQWNGGTTIVAHGSGLLALFSKTLSLHDPLVTTLQGASIDQLSFGAILSQAQQQVDRLSFIPGGTVDGVAVNALNLAPAVAASDAGVTRQVVQISASTHLPMRILGYDGATLVSSIGFSNIKMLERE
jgi:outer membrane lipoprotein-sorting protein